MTSAEKVAAMRARRAAAGLLQVSIFLPKGIVAKIDKVAKRSGVSRSEAASLLLTDALRAAKKDKG